MVAYKQITEDQSLELVDSTVVQIGAEDADSIAASVSWAVDGDIDYYEGPLTVPEALDIARSKAAEFGKDVVYVLMQPGTVEWQPSWGQLNQMCGRFTNEMTWAEIHALYSIHNAPPPNSNMQPRFNIAPTQDVTFAHLDKAGNLELDTGRWWLVPFFAKELPRSAMFNARIETIDTSGAFREGFKSRRCLIPADGYFEWTTNEGDGKKDPWLLQLPGGAGFSFAGIWAHNDNLGITSCTIITAPAVPEIAHIHSRMPVILNPDAYSAWLDTSIQGKDAKALLLGAQMDSALEVYRVSREVNSSRYEGTDTKKPLINSL